MIARSVRAELQRAGVVPREEERPLPEACRLAGEAQPQAWCCLDDSDEEARVLPKLPAAAQTADDAAADELVSVVCPTSSARHWAHPLLYHSFATQTHPHKELLVFDTDGCRSPFFDALDDPRVSYFHVPCSPELGFEMSYTTGAYRDPAPELTARWPSLRGDPALCASHKNSNSNSRPQAICRRHW